MKKKLGLFYKLIMLVIAVVMIALMIMMLFMREYITKREYLRVEEKIELISKRVAGEELIKHALLHKDFSGVVQQYANEILKETGTDFVVVMDTNFIRYSHPTESIIGEQFSNVEDAEQTITQGNHLSRIQGTMGLGVRYFTRIYNQNNDIIGIVCVGYRQVTVENLILEAQVYLVVLMMAGLVVASLLAYVFSKWLKKILLNLEPEEIAKVALQRQLISNHITEGMVAIDISKRVLVINDSAKQILKKASVKYTINENDTLDVLFYQMFFADILDTKKDVIDVQIVLNDVDILLNRKCIYLNNNLYGAVITFKDQSQMQSLITELSQTEKYNDVLRAQSHHFMNQMHVLQGLIELKNYEEVSNYLSFLQKTQHEQLGFLSDKIKVPTIVGLLLSKIEESREKNVNIVIDTDTNLSNYTQYNYIYNELTIILGVLIDNAIEAVKSVKQKNIVVYMLLNQEENVLLCQVTDTGVGIKKEQIENIATLGYSTKGENRGYGLYSVKNIVEKYKGSLDIDVNRSVGTKVMIEIPLTEEV